MHHLITSRNTAEKKAALTFRYKSSVTARRMETVPFLSRDSTLLNPATRPNSCRAAGDQITAIDAIWGDVGFPALRHRQASRSRHHRTTRQAPRRCSSSLLRLGERPHARRRCVRDRCYETVTPMRRREKPLDKCDVQAAEPVHGEVIIVGLESVSVFVLNWRAARFGGRRQLKRVTPLDSTSRRAGRRWATGPLIRLALGRSR